MINFEYMSHSATETMNFAQKLATKLNAGDLIVLNGDLGSGKTKFTEGILKYFGLDSEISSPTFTIVNEYIEINFEKFEEDDNYRLLKIKTFGYKYDSIFE